MKVFRTIGAAVTSILVAGVGFQPLSAELASLDEFPWIGSFAGYANRSFRIAFTTKGEIKLTAMGAKGQPVMDKLVVPIAISIEQTMPDGSFSYAAVVSESLESGQTATDQLEKAVIRGKTKGNAAFEITLEQNRGTILVGGRVLDPGSLVNPLRLILRADFSAPYPYAKENQDEKTSKEFQKKIKGDNITLKLTDKKVLKLAMNEEVDAKSADINGAGITGAEIDICSYDGRKFSFIASPDSAITLSNKQPQPLRKGFSLIWKPDTAKDPEGKSRLAILVR